MKIIQLLLIPAAFVLLFASCALPEDQLSLITQDIEQEASETDTSETTPAVPEIEDPAPEPEPAAAPPETPPVIKTDPDRSRGVYITEGGVQIDIKSIENSSGEIVKCIEVVDFKIFENPSEIEVKAVVVGTREDGQPGIWEIHNDDSIHSPLNENTGTRTSLLSESLERQETLRGRHGWSYIVTGISDDGRMAAGYAIHEDGLELGRWIIDPGTTVGVYWRLWNSDGEERFCTGRAKIIGIKDAPYNNRRRFRGRNRFLRLLSRLRLFFFGWYDTYLTMTESIDYEEDEDLYLIKGSDQEDVKSIAAIDFRDGVLSILEDDPGEEYPDLIISSITVPDTVQTSSDTWELGARVSNIDPATDAGTSTLKYYLSTDSVFDTSVDTLIGSKTIGPIAAGSYADDIWSSAYSISAEGSWYIFAVADADSEVTESDEENNTAGGSVLISSDSDRIVIETFSPTGVGDHSTWTHIALFDSSGDPSPETPYDDSDALADNVFSNTTHMWYARIDTDVDMGGTGLSPGTYYIKVRGESSGQTGPYGIRVVRDPSTSYSYFGSTNPSASPWDDSYEDDDSTTGGIPDIAFSLTPGGQDSRQNRALSDSDIDWYTLTVY